MTPEQQATLLYDWDFWARPEQRVPEGDAWVYWLILAGRGAGKTRTGAETVRRWVNRDGLRYVNLVAATEADVTKVMIFGPSGIMAVCPPHERPKYVGGNLRELRWPNGAVSNLFSAEKPDRLRGHNHEALWCDELAAWRYKDAFDQAQLGLRLGSRPRCIVTTTPRPTPVIKDLLADPATIRTGGSTYANRANLAEAFFNKIIARYKGTRLERQEIYAEILDAVEGALWNRVSLDKYRINEPSLVPTLGRTVVAVDPAMTSGDDADETGIVAAGKADNGHAYVIEDESGIYPASGPDGWPMRVVRLFRRLKADLVVAEVNQGGEMVEATIRMIDPNIPFKAIHATKGKFLRAEPVAALDAQGMVHHVGTFGKMEDQMCAFTPDFERDKGNSPDRMDARVYAITELKVENDFTGMIEFTGQVAAVEAEKKIKANAPPDQNGFIAMIPPPGVSTAYGARGAKYSVGADGVIRVDPKDVNPLMVAGFKPYVADAA